MNQIAAKNFPVKIYLDADAYLAIKAKCDTAGLSMSAAGNLAFRQWQPAHRIRRAPGLDMPRTGPRKRNFPGDRPHFGGMRVPLRV